MHTVDDNIGAKNIINKSVNIILGFLWAGGRGEVLVRTDCLIIFINKDRIERNSSHVFPFRSVQVYTLRYEFILVKKDIAASVKLKRD